MLFTGTVGETIWLGNAAVAGRCYRLAPTVYYVALFTTITSVNLQKTHAYRQRRKEQQGIRRAQSSF